MSGNEQEESREEMDGAIDNLKRNKVVGWDSLEEECFKFEGVVENEL